MRPVSVPPARRVHGSQPCRTLWYRAGGARRVAAVHAAAARVHPAGAAAGVEATDGAVEAGSGVEHALGAAVEPLGRAEVARCLVGSRLDLAGGAPGAEALVRAFLRPGAVSAGSARDAAAWVVGDALSCASISCLRSSTAPRLSCWHVGPAALGRSRCDQRSSSIARARRLVLSNGRGPLSRPFTGSTDRPDTHTCASCSV
jgi:hypothetical protein